MFTSINDDDVIPNTCQTLIVSKTFNVVERVRDLRHWYDEWLHEDRALEGRIIGLDPKKKIDRQKATQISNYRRRLRMQLVQIPIEISPEEIMKYGYDEIRENLVIQFASLSKKDRLIWLTNFLFIMTSDIRKLNDKIANVRSYRSFGQQRNFLLGGPSGMGKTTFLDWYASNYLPKVEAEFNYVPIIKIDAPVSNSTPRAILQRMILECGMVYSERENEEDLLMLLVLLFHKCRVELVIVDEIQHIIRPELRRRLLEISNLARGVPIICASCDPHRWVEGDLEIAGRWNDFFGLENYTKERLHILLAYIELLLPFTQNSYLISDTAAKIEELTGGIFRDIMILLVDASRKAISQNLPSLTKEFLIETWKEIQSERVTDFLVIFNRIRSEL